MKHWHERALELAKQGVRYCDIARQIEHEYGLKKDMYSAVRSYLYNHRHDLEETNAPSTQKQEKRVAIQNQEPEHYDSDWDGTTEIKFAVISDSHLGSKYTQLTHLHRFYDICEKKGVKDIYHAGDITDGLKMRAGHEYELYLVSADEMRDDVVKNYPLRPGITTHFITGNHDASIYKHVGYDIGYAIAKERPDMKYLGRDCAVVNLTPNCTLELRHPWDGGSYAISYKVQKMVEAMESDSKPNILVVGHYHKNLTLFHRNVHCVLPGCFQSQTPFTRGKCLAVSGGGYIITVNVDKDGTIQSFIPEFLPIYASIKDDYKNFK